MEKSELLSMLSTGIVSIKFTKKDGTERDMTCTRSLSIIPVESHPRSPMSDVDIEDNIRVFDTEIREWRSFSFEALITASAAVFNNFFTVR